MALAHGESVVCAGGGVLRRRVDEMQRGAVGSGGMTFCRGQSEGEREEGGQVCMLA